MKRKMVYLNDLQHDAITQIAEALDIPFAQALRRVIDDGLQAPTDRQSIPIRQRALLQLEHQLAAWQQQTQKESDHA